MSWLYFQEDWALQHVCTFDGVAKVITVGPNTSSISVKSQIYSDWKEWASLRDNAKFLPAIRTTGGDPIGGGAYTGDVYFLINGWRILIDHSCNIDGVIYSDDYPSPFIQVTGTQIVTNKVSSLVSVIAPVVSVEGLTVPTTAEIWSYASRTLSAGQIPSVSEIRTEMDNNSSLLQAIFNREWTETEKSQIRNRLGIDGTSSELPIAIPTLATSAEVNTVHNAVSTMSISTSAINSPVSGFTLNTGLVTSGTYLDTQNLNGISHVISDNLTNFNIEYSFDIGLNAVPNQLTFVGNVFDQHETAVISAWNYVNSAWEPIGKILGSKAPGSSTFTLFRSHVGFLAGQIGDVRIQFTSATVSDIILTVDQLFVSYAIVPKETGYSGHAVTADAYHIQLGPDASTVDNYYVPSLVSVNHGTGALQYAKVIGYTGATRMLHLEQPMATVLDSSSHITLSPWGNSDSATIADAVRTELTPELTHVMQIPTTGSGLTPTQETMLLEMYELLGLSPYKPLIVTQTSRSVVGSNISQTIVTDSNSTTVSRN